MYVHPKLAAFVATLEAMFNEADGFLEDDWGGAFPLHPNRPARGFACNPEMDGLFEIAPDFTLGIGSGNVRGYRISLRAATLERVPPAQAEFLMEQAAAFIARKLPEYFPGRSLKVVRDSKGFKITGDFSLGYVS
ncbi:MAG: hypothetical protein LBU18_00550 [Treponema sp.]|nr:hypothetical protein [Treponema sp.]